MNKYRSIVAQFPAGSGGFLYPQHLDMFLGLPKFAFSWHRKILIEVKAVVAFK
jgi:hypothetical protein